MPISAAECIQLGRLPFRDLQGGAIFTKTVLLMASSAISSYIQLMLYATVPTFPVYYSKMSDFIMVNIAKAVNKRKSISSKSSGFNLKKTKRTLKCKKRCEVIGSTWPSRSVVRV